MTGLRILVVDDDRDAAEELVELLECHGYVARSASDLATARDAVASFDPDWALVDLLLGPESGLDLVREWGAAARPRVVLVSGLDPMPEPGVPSLLKPIDLAQLEDHFRS